MSIIIAYGHYSMFSGDFNTKHEYKFMDTKEQMYEFMINYANEKIKEERKKHNVNYKLILKKDKEEILNNEGFVLVIDEEFCIGLYQGIFAYIVKENRSCNVEHKNGGIQTPIKIDGCKEIYLTLD